MTTLHEIRLRDARTGEEFLLKRFRNPDRADDYALGALPLDDHFDVFIVPIEPPLTVVTSLHTRKIS